jgi:4-amino-4-deoxy-L-arabinose transferase-like glycosyltransferase
LFGLLASLALLTKGSAMGLAVLPPLAILLAHRRSLVRLPSFWLPALVVDAACGPWHWVTRRMEQNVLIETGASFHDWVTAAGHIPIGLIFIFSGAGLAFIGLGVVARLIRPAFREGVEPLWAAVVH